MKRIYYAWAFVLLYSCGQQNNTSPATTTEENPAVTSTADNVPATRTTVSKEPVAEYKVKTDNPLNDWYFSVKLYETPKTFHYLMQLRFEEIEGKDTLKLPNFGIMPKPVIKKGPEQYSCIIGFMDKDNQFREYKKVYVVNNRLKVTALKHYAVSAY
ncbi:MAG: hypothetical protein QM731_04160 [Chitinophagaceae bacterium]